MARKSQNAAQEVRFEVPVPDFVPYACHYDTNTILTKNGELIQTIKITGFSYEKVGAEKVDLRETVRKAIASSINSGKFSLWFHTIRRKTDLSPSGEYPDGFSNYLNDRWNERHEWHDKYVNELYITVIHEGISADIKRTVDFVRSLFFRAYKRHHDRHLNKAWVELNEVTEHMLLMLRHYGARRLSLVTTREGIYSEPLQFFGKILHLSEEKVLIPLMDAAEYLATHRVAFGFNTLEIIGKKGKRFGAIFTIKEYHEISPGVLDRLLQLPQEFIIAQSLDFIPRKEAVKDYEYQDYVLKVSNDEELANIVGLSGFMGADAAGVTNYAKQQITVLILAEALDALGEEVTQALNAVKSLGLVAVREDLRMEECYWAQLPANFAFLTRQNKIDTARVGGFASLHNFPAGQISGNLWGPAVTVFYTAIGTPYFFNFHYHDSGHMTIVGPQHSGKTVLLNFMVSQARKFNGKLFFFDQFFAAKVFIKALGGNYTTIDPVQDKPSSYYNPLLLPDVLENRAFLERWFGYLLKPSGEQLSEEEWELTKQLVEKLYTLAPEKRQLSELMTQCDASIAARFGLWYGEGKYAHLFDNEDDSFDVSAPIQAWGMSQVVQEKDTIGPVLSYLFHRIERLLDGTPTMIVLDEAWKLVNNPIFAPGMGAWLDRLREHNAMVIFATETMEDVSKRKITAVITEKIATQIFLPNPQGGEAYTDVWRLTPEEYEKLRGMQAEERHFLLKHGNVTVIAKLDLYGMNDVLPVLSGGENTVQVMDAAIEEVGDNPDDWLPVFYDKVSQRR